MASTARCATWRVISGRVGLLLTGESLDGAGPKDDAMQPRDWSCVRSGAFHLQLDRILRRASKMPCVMVEIAWPQHWSHQRPLGGAKEVLDVPLFEAQVEQSLYHITST